MKLSALMRREDFGQQEIVKILEMDQVLASVILRLANSAAYSRDGAVTKLAVAVQRIGARQIHALAMASGVQDSGRRPGPLASLRRRVWIESLTAARVSELLGALEQAPPGVSFVAGLLHDIGKNLAIASIEALLLKHPDEASRSEEGWWSLIETFHVELGVELAKRWNLPPDLSRVLAEHHLPQPTDPLVGRIALADELVGRLMASPGLTPAELRTLVGISMPEADALTEEICNLPQFLMAFEAEGEALEPETDSKVLAPAPPLPAPVRTVAIVIGGASHQPASGVIWSTQTPELTAKLSVALRANQLVRVQFPGATEELFFGKTGSCREENGAFFVAITPFSLKGKQQLAWASLLTEPAPRPTGD